jgi:GTPase Era involved in 16S rRNA processing
MIKRIREEAEKDLADIFDYEVKLKLSVRVDPDWKKNDKTLEKLINEISLPAARHLIEGQGAFPTGAM